MVNGSSSCDASSELLLLLMLLVLGLDERSASLPSLDLLDADVSAFICEPVAG